MTEFKPGDIVRLTRESNTVVQFVGKLYRVITLEEYADELFGGSVNSLPVATKAETNLVAVTLQPDGHNHHRYHYLEKTALEKVA